MRVVLFFILIFLFSCGGNEKSAHTFVKEEKSNQHKKEIDITINISDKATVGDVIDIRYKVKKIPQPDSVKISVDYVNSLVFWGDDSLLYNTSNALPGKHDVQMVFYWGDSIAETKNSKITFLSDIIPEKYGYKVIEKWPHNTRAYTQGLEFSGKYLYEGTGLNKESMLVKKDLDKNEVLQSINLPDDVFGEGITILNDKIYQLTWRSNTGFVYDKNSLNKLFEFSYPTEGWGLTNDGKELIMSDGSENIYFLDTEFIQETHHIQVYDNKGPVVYLNELEEIDTLIYANVYGSDYIVAFDENTGKVVKHIDLTGILDKQKIKTPVDVLNGIAWDSINNRLIVTGKWWPWLYHIELVKK